MLEIGKMCIKLKQMGISITEIQSRKTTTTTTTAAVECEKQDPKCSFDGIKCNLHVTLDFQHKFCLFVRFFLSIKYYFIH